MWLVNCSYALKEFYNSKTFAKLSDETIGLYIESSATDFKCIRVHAFSYFSGRQKGQTIGRNRREITDGCRKHYKI